MITNLVELIKTNKSNEKGITFIEGKDGDKFVSYLDVYINAKRILSNLQKAGIKRGDSLIFQIPKNETFVQVFWACILGGIIPVPVTIGTNFEHNLKLFRIWEVLQSPYCILTNSRLEELREMSEQEDLVTELHDMERKMLFIEDVMEVTEEEGQLTMPNSDDIAFIQFSSGSTGDPKGVMVTHENLITNVSDYREALEITQDDSNFGWMPLTHDFGIIGNHLFPIYCDINQYLSSTDLFKRNPLSWLEKTSTYRPTILTATNFAFQFVLNRLNRKKDVKLDWDLSSVRAISTGADPLSPDLEKEFLKALEKYQLNQKSIRNAYGLAEGTLFVTLSPANQNIRYYNLDRNYLSVGDEIVQMEENHPDVLKVVDEGLPAIHTKVRICDEQDQVLEENRVGYVQLLGKSITKGYYNNEEASKASFTEDGWLNTGDLGFLREGRLSITGRAKEIIIIEGQNIYPHDLERVISEIKNFSEYKSFRVVCSGAWDERRNEEKVLIFVKLQQKVEDFADFVKEVNNHLAERMNITSAEVIPVKSIPQTTSGKIQRVKLSNMYLNGELSEIIRKNKIQVSNEEIFATVTEDLKVICKEVLELTNIGLHENFKDLGISSKLLKIIHTKLDEIYPNRITIADIYEYPTISQLSKFIIGQGKHSTNNKNSQSQVSKSELEGIINQIENNGLSTKEAVESLKKL